MNSHVEQGLEINEDNLMGGSPELNVLFIKHCSLLKSLPLIISLKALVLHDCDSLGTIAVVGQFKSLEILFCSYCNSIKELPEQVRGLKHLKLLQISQCRDLKRVAAGVISSMVGLEELKIVDSFHKWKGGEIEDGKEASLKEIESLKKLRCLDIQVSDVALAAQPLGLSPDLLVQFRVRFGKIMYVSDMGEKSCKRRMSLDFGHGNDIKWGDLSTNMFLSRTECLYAIGLHEDFKLNLATAPSLRWLSLESFGNKKNIASAAAAFPLLDSLSLEDMHSLDEIWDTSAPIPSNSFNNLKHLKLVNLRALKRMGETVSAAANDFFLQLETIHIQKCDEMEHLLVVLVLDEEEHDIKTALSFPKLKKFRLDDVPNLRSICNRGIESIRFPLLAQLEIECCENLRCLLSRDDDDDDHHQDADDYDDGDSLHLFCHAKVSFDNLKELTLSGTESKNVWCDHVPVSFFTELVTLDISSCYKIRSLFSSSKIPQNLVSLRILKIGWCEDMVTVVEDEQEVSISIASSLSSCDQYPPLFHSLQEIHLAFVPKLESFCERRCALELPSLNYLRIDECREMKSFNAAGPLITPALQAVTTHYENLDSVQDLNAALQQRFEDFKLFQEEWKKKKKNGEERFEEVEAIPSLDDED